MTDLLTRHRARHLSVVASVEVEQHPDWCYSKSWCGSAHYTDYLPVPATVGDFRYYDGSAEFPLFEAAAQIEDGVRSVNLSLKSPLVDGFPRTSNWCGGYLTPDEARRLATALMDAISGEDRAVTVTGRSLYGTFTATVHWTPDGVRVAASFGDGVDLVAEMRPAEARKLADVLDGHAALLSGPTRWVDVMVPEVRR